MSATAISLGHHARVPAQLVAEVSKPRAMQILTHLLTLCNPQKPEVWIDQGLVGKTLGIHRDTVGRWIRHLEDVGRLVFLGFRHDGRRKRYRINMAVEQNSIHEKERDMKMSNVTSGDFVGHPQAQSSDDVRQNCRNINRKEKTELKEQTKVCFDKKEFSSNEKIALKQKLKALGVHKNVIDKLVSKFSAEKINNQIAHLQLVIGRGEHIEKPASWLITAIKNNFELPKELDKTAIEEEQKIKEQREATELAQRAQREISIGNIQEAKELARKSLLLAENGIAKEILEKEEEKLERQVRIAQARARVSAEKLELIREEEEKKKLLEMRKLVRWSDIQILNSSLFKSAVEELVNERFLNMEPCF